MAQGLQHEPPRPTLERQLRAAGALMLILGCVAGIAWGVYWLAVGRPLLAGEHGHDFGSVTLGDEPVKLAHSFVLTNRSSHPVEIIGTKTSCGCTVATPSVSSVAPGGTVRIDSTLTLRKEGRKQATIFLVYPSGRQDTLHLEASARKKKRLYAAPVSWAAEPGRIIDRSVFYLDYESNDMPPAPTLTSPRGVSASFEGWTQLERRRRLEGRPARWKGTIQIERSLETPSGDAPLVIRVDDQELIVNATKRD